MQILHHGFACNTEDGFVLAFAHGNLGDTTSFKTVNRDDMVAPAALEPVELGDDGPARAWRVPRLDNMMAAESPEEFTNLEAADNTILTRIPNHCLITASTFEEVGGAKVVSAKDLAFKIIEAFRPRRQTTMRSVLNAKPKRRAWRTHWHSCGRPNKGSWRRSDWKTFREHHDEPSDQGS
ncbi:hypothetical protein MHU86_16879 [Fragilaria crotonensis]|nr:hypothetical protein MHU86_16879 [Fragilaria crotonensis]